MIPVRAWTRGVQALDMLNVDRADDVDAVVEQEENIFVSLGETAAFDIGVGQFIDQSNLWSALQYAIDVKFGEECPFVFNFAAGNVFQFAGQFSSAGASMGFDDADDDVFATRSAANAFAQHAEGLADAGSVAEEDLEAASSARLRRRHQRFEAIPPESSGLARWISSRRTLTPMNSRRLIPIIRWTTAFGVLAGIVIAYRHWVHVNPTTVALTLVLFVLVLAAAVGVALCGGGIRSRHGCI